MLLIENTEPRVIGIGLARKPEGIDLLPGINELAPDDWKEAKKSPTVQHYIKTKVLRLAGTKALDKLPLLDAQEVVLNTFDLELLRRWEAAPLHKEVAKCVRAQIAEMTTMPAAEADLPERAGT